MSLLDKIKIGLKVASQKEVIAVLVICILFISLAKYVIKYRKKPPRFVSHAPKAEPAAEQANAGEANAAEGNTSAQEE